MGNLSWGTVLELITAQTRAFLESIDCEEVVIGLSGGIDSSMVAVIAMNVFKDPRRIHGVWMPGPYSTLESRNEAEELARKLGIECQTINIKDAYNAFAASFEKGYEKPLQGLAAENTQARLRMCALMALSNEFGWGVLNTGNLSEACMGYSTLYGDTCGVYAPIGGLYKTEVYKLARTFNMGAEAAGVEPYFSESLLTKPPSAELFEGQRDEDALGMSYAELDELLQRMIDFGEDPKSISPKAVEVWNRYQTYEYKRALEPPYPFFERLKKED